MRSTSRAARLLSLGVIAVFELFRSAPALAQARVLTLDELRCALSPGDFISVVQTTGDSVRGRLVRFADTELDIRYAAAIDYNEIDAWGPSYVGVGAVVTGIGALIGWAVDALHSKPHVR